MVTNVIHIDFDIASRRCANSNRGVNSFTDPGRVIDGGDAARINRIAPNGDGGSGPGLIPAADGLQVPVVGTTAPAPTIHKFGLWPKDAMGVSFHAAAPIEFVHIAEAAGRVLARLRVDDAW